MSHSDPGPSKILLTGATGYIGKRLLPVLLDAGHTVICCVRDKARFDTARYSSNRLHVIEVDFLDKETLKRIPDDIDAAYYLIHSMSSSDKNFRQLEQKTANHFRERLEQTTVGHVIFLGGIVNQEKLSEHLKSRKQVEKILTEATFNTTTLRAGIIVGSGSASFEIIRDLVEKLPMMIAPRWIETRTQPIAIRNVIQFLHQILLKTDFYNQGFDIGGPDIMSYREMLLRFAHVRGLRRTIVSVPVLTPKLSSYWLYFVTSTSYPLAISLVDSMMVEVVCTPNRLAEELNIKPIDYESAIKLAFDKIEQQTVQSSWTDALSSNILQKGIAGVIDVPVFGCYKDRRSMPVEDPERTIDKLWKIGGETGWYYADKLWEFRGVLDKLVGGVGLRRGRKSPTQISTGDSLDFWRVLHADKSEGRLLLYAEMKLPGEAWLDFQIKDGVITQTATFRPLGVAGRLYWFTVYPFHGIIFKGMIRSLAS